MSRHRSRSLIVARRHRLIPALVPLEERALLSTVTSLLDDGSPGTLRYAVAHAAPAETIAFAPGLKGTITLTQGPITISQSLTIAGPGAPRLAVSGNNASGIFSIAPSSSDVSAPVPVVTIDGLTLRDGNAVNTSYYGAAILAQQTTLTLSDDQFVNNQAGAGGGAISTFPNTDFNQFPPVLGISTLTIQDSTFTGNQGGAASVFDTLTNVRKSTFQNNSGSAVENYQSFGDTTQNLTVTDCTFTCNVVTADGFALGGAIFNNGTALIQDSLFQGNRADGTIGGLGGAIANSFGASLMVSDSTFDQNVAATSGMAGSVANGGAIHGDAGSNITVIGSLFVGNRAESAGNAYGGAIDNQGGGFSGPPAGLSVANSTFLGNTAQGLAVPDSISGGANAWGGAINNSGGFLSLSQVAFLKNAARGGSSTGEAGSAFGGAVLNEDATLTVSAATFVGNLAQSGTGATFGGFAVGGGLVDQFAPYSFNGPVVSTISGSSFVGNAAVGGNGSGSAAPGGLANGGGLALTSAGTVNVTCTSFVANTATGGNAGAGGTAGAASGGGLSSTETRLTISDASFIANRARAGDSPTGTAGDALGGGLGVSNFTPSPVALTRVSFSGNRAVGGTGSTGGNAQGGGIALYSAIATLTDLQVTGNAAQAGPAGQGLGGGAFIDPASTVQISKKSKIVGNTATTAGANIYGTYTLI